MLLELLEALLGNISVVSNRFEVFRFNPKQSKAHISRILFRCFYILPKLGLR
jgi:hypothetical protein